MNTRALIKDFEAKDKASLFLRLTDIQYKKTTANDDYASMLGFDGFNLIEVKMWRLREEDKEILKNGEVYYLTGSMREYQGKIQFNINEIRHVEEEDNLDLSEFYEKSKYTRVELEEKIFEYINKIDNKVIKSLVMNIITNYKEKFFTYPAAMNVHHNFKSGLAEHTYSMLRASDAYLGIYSYLNKDLVYAGIILHDIGKLIELSGHKGTGYTKKGNLIGHIPIGFTIINEQAKKESVEDSEEVLILQHIILSHHGLLEYGSPKEPVVAEALLVFLLDYNDSRLAALEKEIESTGKGEFTNSIFALDRRSFYIPDIE